MGVGSDDIDELHSFAGRNLAMKQHAFLLLLGLCLLFSTVWVKGDGPLIATFRTNYTAVASASSSAAAVIVPAFTNYRSSTFQGNRMCLLITLKEATAVYIAPSDTGSVTNGHILQGIGATFSISVSPVDNGSYIAQSLSNSPAPLGISEWGYGQ